MTQVPAERRIKVADTLRLLFHYFNVVNLTLGLIVFGVGGSLILHPLPLGGIKEVTMIFTTLMITAIVVLTMGVLGIHVCYRVQENGLKFYAVSALVAITLEACLGSMTIIKESTIENKIKLSLVEFNKNTFPGGVLSGKDLIAKRLSQYKQNTTYQQEVDHLHTVLSCCSFASNSSDWVESCFASNYHQATRKPLPSCSQSFTEFVRIKLLYIRCLAFMLLPVQAFCLIFDLMVIKTLKVTKDYEKLERELSIRKRVKRLSQGYIPTSDVFMPGALDTCKLQHN